MSSEETNVSVSPLHDPAATAAAAIAQLRSQNQQYDEQTTLPMAITPDSTGDADSGVETKSIDIKSESDHCTIDADSGDEVPPAETATNARILDVRCGNLTGRLYEERFTCPGIHKKCIEFEGKLISPRQFTIKAEKDKQKDWKGSIRVGRYNLRTLMEMKKIDFYEHETNCSLKCQSRNYIKNRKQAAMENSFSFLDSLVKSGASMAAAANELSYDQPSSSSNFNGNDFNTSSISNNNNNDENGFNNNTTRKGSSALEEYVSRMSSSSNNSAAALAKIGISTVKESHDTDHLIQQQSNQIQQQQTTTQIPNLTNISGGIDLSTLQQSWKGFSNNNNNQFNPGLQNFQTITKQNSENDQLTVLINNLMEQQKNLLAQNYTLPNNNFINSHNEEFLKAGDALNGATVKKIMEQQPVMFWERMRELNMVDDLTSHLSQVLEHAKQVYKNSDPRTDALAAAKLSSVALALSVSDDFARKIQASFVQSALQKEIQRKAAEEKRKMEAKRKNEVLDQLMKVSQQMDPQQLQLIQQILQQQAQQSPDIKKIRLNI